MGNLKSTIPLVLAVALAGVAMLQPQRVHAQRAPVVIHMCTAPVHHARMDVDRMFGALAFDDRAAVWYATYGYPSNSKAKKGAIAHCQENGGSSCKLMLSYSNQCAAVARATENGFGVPGKDSVNTGSTEGEAEANALRACEADWGVSCTTQFVNCSHSGIRRWTETTWQSYQCGISGTETPVIDWSSPGSESVGLRHGAVGRTSAVLAP